MGPRLAHNLAQFRPRSTNRDFGPLKAQNWYPHSPLLTTHRAALGGTLTARELWLRRIWFLLLFVFMLLYGDARPWPYTLWCILPAGEHGPRGFDLVIGDLPCRVFPVWY